MRNDVVQLARDAEALAFGSLLTLLLMPRDEVAEEAAPRSQVIPDDPGDQRQRSSGQQHARGLEGAQEKKSNRGEDDRDRSAGDHQPQSGPVVHRHRISRKSQRQSRGLTIGADGKHHCFEADDEEEHRDRIASPPPERRRLQQDGSNESGNQ